MAQNQSMCYLYCSEGLSRKNVLPSGCLQRGPPGVPAASPPQQPGGGGGALYGLRRTNALFGASELFFSSSLFLSGLTRGKFYPQRYFGHAVVTMVAPSPHRYAHSFLSRVGFSNPTARRCSSNVSISRSRAFR